jgi:hypothetical protein
MPFPSGSDRPVAGMIYKRCLAMAVLVCLGPLLGSCGGASENGFSSYVADHWPHWAGGMPADVPPRPGTPGYDEFIAHGQSDQDATKSPATSAPPVFTATKPTAAAGKPISNTSVRAAPVAPVSPSPAPATTTQAAPSSDRPAEDSSVVKGGLY